jgi:hypothetical protein
MSRSEAEISWQEAVARLARERSLAETYARLLKQYGNPQDIAFGATSYGEAKSEYDGIIRGLIVALARKKSPDSLPDLERRLRNGFEKRVAFCKGVQRVAAAPEEGGKGLIEEAVKGAVGPLVEAIKAIWLRSKDDNALMRSTIETQLEAALWPSFDTVTAEQ